MVINYHEIATIQLDKFFFVLNHPMQKKMFIIINKILLILKKKKLTEAPNITKT